VKVLQGSVVKSIAGHDKNSHYVAIKVDNEYVYIADGKERKLEKPKRKNIKHISMTTTVFNLDEVTNKKLRKLLAEFDSTVNKITNINQNSLS